MNNDNEFIIDAKKLSIEINGTTAINYGDFSIPYGKLVTIEGKNGSGKSTFLKLLTGYGSYYEVYGALNVIGMDVIKSDKSLLRRKIVSLDQEDSFIVAESVFSALKRSSMIAISGMENKKELKLKVKEMANDYYEKYIKDFLTGITVKKYRRVSSFSGGQKKIIHILQQIIKAKVIGAELLLMDEPLNNLDKNNKKLLIDLIKELRNDNPRLTILLITHCRLFPNVNATLTMTDGGAIYQEYPDGAKYYDCLSD